MIDPGHQRLSIARRCESRLDLARLVHRSPAGESEESLAPMRLIDETFLECRSTAPENGDMPSNQLSPLLEMSAFQ